MQPLSKWHSVCRMSFLLISFHQLGIDIFNLTQMISCTLTDHPGGLIRPSLLQTVCNTAACLGASDKNTRFFFYEVRGSTTYHSKLDRTRGSALYKIHSLWNPYWRLIHPVSHTRFHPDARKTKHQKWVFFPNPISSTSRSIMPRKPSRHPGPLNLQERSGETSFMCRNLFTAEHSEVLLHWATTARAMRDGKD